MSRQPTGDRPASERGLDAGVLAAEMAWLTAIIDGRMRTYFAADGSAPDVPPAPALPARGSRYAALVQRLSLGEPERIVLALALAPHLSPQLLDVFFVRNRSTDRGFTEFGGLKGTGHAGFVPTGETALFVLAGDDMDARLRAMRIVEPAHPLFASGVLQLGSAAAQEPAWSGALAISVPYMRHLASGAEPRPAFGPTFPARRVTTRLSWDDLVLEPEARAEVASIVAWARHRDAILGDWKLDRHAGRGFAALFYGPSGTGKTLTACLLGQELGLDVFSVDLSQVVSKYIGETEKNLAAVFDEAERWDWVLFFDEADALFGKRTSTSTAHDRYANQEVSFLLQRLEEYKGITVLATNLRSNFDEAFQRRFHAIVPFPLPDAGQRERLWRGIVGDAIPLAGDVDLAALARAHELTGAQIVNVVRHACLQAHAAGSASVTTAALGQAIRRELRKEGR